MNLLALLLALGVQDRGLFDYDTLNLSGSAALVDADNDYDLETIDSGTADARWTGDAGELDFAGTFEGRSSDDPPSVHRIRERMSGLH